MLKNTWYYNPTDGLFKNINHVIIINWYAIYSLPSLLLRIIYPENSLARHKFADKIIFTMYLRVLVSCEEIYQGYDLVMQR